MYQDEAGFRRINKPKALSSGPLRGPQGVRYQGKYVSDHQTDSASLHPFDGNTSEAVNFLLIKQQSTVNNYEIAAVKRF
jgi:hypothetical protein